LLSSEAVCVYNGSRIGGTFHRGKSKGGVEMKDFLKMVLAVWVALLVIVLASGLLLGIVAVAKSGVKPGIKDGSYLVLDIDGEILDYAPGGVVEEIFGGGPGSHMQILENLEKAAVDERIKGVILKVGVSTLGYAKMHELREAIRRVRDAGKKVYAYSEGLYNRHFYVATACDSIFMPPSGFVELTGAVGGALFVKKALDKLGIEPNVHKIDKYKTAAELVTRERMSPEAKEQETRLLEDM